MRVTTFLLPLFLATLSTAFCAADVARAEVRAWEGQVTIPTYRWEEDFYPKFWALEGGAKMSTTVRGAITYPYVMQDHLLREKIQQSYKALFLENEYLKVTCLPELGGRLHSIFDKSTGEEMFYLNHVVKPGMIAMRGAWISGGVEWNAGPHGHTVTALSPVDALVGRNKDGSAFLQISNQEKIFRTRWVVRVTLHPGRSLLDERICIANPTDGMHPYYFWNCTAFPNRPGTRFIYPMSLGTDHNGTEFFQWPIHKGRDLTWLKNYETYASIFAVNCSYDFFGAYDVDADRGIVQVANRHQLSGKKAWTWGEWEFGKISQQNLTDEDGPYIEVQSGPLPTQSDYGMLGPRERVEWQEWWIPVHGLGNGFEFATKDVVAQTIRSPGKLTILLLATAKFEDAVCTLRSGDRQLHREMLDLAPDSPAAVVLEEEPRDPVAVTLTTGAGKVIAEFTTPLPVPKVDPPAQADWLTKADDQLSVQELYLNGRKQDRATNRTAARKYYELALSRDPWHLHSLRSLAVLDFEAGQFASARSQLEKALSRDSDDGLCCYYLGVCNLRENNVNEAMHWGYRATRCPGTVSIGYDLVGRAQMVVGDVSAAVNSFENAVRANNLDATAVDHLMIALHAAGDKRSALRWASRRMTEDPSALVPRAVLGLQDDAALERFSREVRSFAGEVEFEVLEASLEFAELGQFSAAARILHAVCVQGVAEDERSFLPLYYLAWYMSQSGDESQALRWLEAASKSSTEGIYASRPREVDILRYALKRKHGDSRAHLQLGCLLAHLGRTIEAVAAWRKAAEIDPGSSVALRNLGLEAAAKNDLAGAEALYRRAIAARPADQTLYRDLAEILIAADRRSAAIALLEGMPRQDHQRAEITVILAESYVSEQRFDDCIKLLESIPYFVNWEGQDVTWRLFNRAHIERGKRRLEKRQASQALADFESALTYPANLNVGRSDKPQEAPAQYWRGRALAALGRHEDARAAWQAGAAGADVSGWQNEYRLKCRQALAGKDKS